MCEREREMARLKNNAECGDTWCNAFCEVVEELKFDCNIQCEWERTKMRLFFAKLCAIPFEVLKYNCGVIKCDKSKIAKNKALNRKTQCNALQCLSERQGAHAASCVTSQITSHGPLCYGDWTLRRILLNATDYNDVQGSNQWKTIKLLVTTAMIIGSYSWCCDGHLLRVWIFFAKKKMTF